MSTGAPDPETPVTAETPDDELVDEHGTPTADWLPESDKPGEQGPVP